MAKKDKNFEFSVTTKTRADSPVSLGLEDDILGVEEVDLNSSPKLRASLSGLVLPKEFSAVFRTIGETNGNFAPSPVSEALLDEGLTYRPGVSCFVAKLKGRKLVTYFLKRTKSKKKSDVSGTHRINFLGDIRNGKKLKAADEVATILTRAVRKPSMEWIVRDGNRVHRTSAPLKQKVVYDIPVNEIPPKYQDVIIIASQGTKSHGH